MVVDDNASEVHRSNVGLCLFEERHKAVIPLEFVSRGWKVVMARDRSVTGEQKGRGRHEPISTRTRLVSPPFLPVLRAPDMHDLRSISE
jgi:hypothetical protein